MKGVVMRCLEVHPQICDRKSHSSGRRETQRDSLDKPAERQIHDRILDLLARAKAAGLTERFTISEQAESYPSEKARNSLLTSLRDLAARKGIRALFGSRKHRYSWLPTRFLLIRRHGELADVFPCRVENGYIEPEDFLAAIIAGEVWAPGAWRRPRESRHRRIVDALAANPERLGPGLRLDRKELAVSGELERGRIDLLLRDQEDRFLIVEVKIKASELDQAIGQLARHRRLIASNYFIDRARVRIAIACLDIPNERIADLNGWGIEFFRLPLLILYKPARTPEPRSQSAQASARCREAAEPAGQGLAIA